jgi:hypothetical protein
MRPSRHDTRPPPTFRQITRNFYRVDAIIGLSVIYRGFRATAASIAWTRSSMAEGLRRMAKAPALMACERNRPSPSSCAVRKTMEIRKPFSGSCVCSCRPLVPGRPISRMRQHSFVAYRRVHAQRRHAHIVHQDDSKPHHGVAHERQLPRCRYATTHCVQRESRYRTGSSKDSSASHTSYDNFDWKGGGEHSDEMHCPYTRPHRDASPPSQTRAALFPRQAVIREPRSSATEEATNATTTESSTSRPL